MYSRIALIALVNFVWACGLLMGQAVQYAPVVGQAHSDFELPSIQDGKPLRLSGLRGKKVLLMHFASW